MEGRFLSGIIYRVRIVVWQYAPWRMCRRKQWLTDGWMRRAALLAAGTGVRRACARRAALVTVSVSRHSSPTQSSPSTLDQLTSLLDRPSSSCSNNFHQTVPRSLSPVSHPLPTSFPVPVSGRERRRRAAETAVVPRRYVAAAACWWRRVTVADVVGRGTRPRRVAVRCRGTAVAVAGRGRPLALRRSCVRGQVATERARRAWLRRHSARRRAVSPSTWVVSTPAALSAELPLPGGRGSITSASATRRGAFDVETPSPSTTTVARRRATVSASCRQHRACLACLRRTRVSASLPGLNSSSTSRCLGPEARRRLLSQYRLNSRLLNGSRSKIYKLFNWPFSAYNENSNLKTINKIHDFFDNFWMCTNLKNQNSVIEAALPIDSDCFSKKIKIKRNAIKSLKSRNSLSVYFV